MEDYSQNFRDLVALYTKTKALILRAEQVDPDSSSNIAVFKEQRDAADHLMRVLGTIYNNPPEGVNPDEYIKTHFHKARGHLYRAAFDALDGVGISSKLLMKQSLEGISNEAISSVYPEYWQKILEFDKLDAEVTSHRNTKDVGNNTLSHLESYSQVVDRLFALTQEVRQRVPHFHEWEARNNNKQAKDLKFDLKKEAWKYLLFILIGGLAYKAAEALLFKPESSRTKAAASTPSTNSVSATNPPALKSP